MFRNENLTKLEPLLVIVMLLNGTLDMICVMAIINRFKNRRIIAPGLKLIADNAPLKLNFETILF